MPLRMAITKSTAQGEQFVVDVCQWNPVTGELLHTVGEMQAMGEEALRLGDARLLEMNARMLEAYNLEKYFSPETWSKIIDILDILSGRQSVDLVSRRWQSTVEENEELARIRAEAFASNGQ